MEKQMFKKFGDLAPGTKFTGRHTGNTLLKTRQPGTAVILSLGSRNGKGTVGKLVVVSDTTDVIDCTC